MALISETTFNPLARYVNVRMQQGVPIVDADVNELDDIRKFELRAFLKWFVGDGVPDGNDGFRVDGADLDNDFLIRFGGSPGGDATPTERGLRNVGRIIVDGLDVTIAADLAFTKQDLYKTSPGADALAARLRVSVVNELTVPTADTTMGVYLDVWETLVTADDDTALLHSGLGVETCARVRRDWVVRVRDHQEAPQSGDADFAPGHSYVLLAQLTRRKGKPQIRRGDVVDRRHQRLQLPPATLVEDVMGMSTADYRTGLRRPPISLRDAVNALLRGELLTSSETAVAPASGPNVLDKIGRAFLLDSANEIVAVFSSDRAGAEQVYAARMSLDAVAEGFTAPVQVTSGLGHTAPSVVQLPNGSLFVVSQVQSGAKADIVARRGSLNELPAAADIAVATTQDVAEDTPFVVAAGPVVTVFFHKTTPGVTTTERWCYRRWNSDTETWVDPTALELAAADTTVRDFHAAVDTSGKILAVFKTADAIMSTQLDPGSGAPPTPPIKLAERPGGASEPPFVLCPRGGGAWVFWQDNGIVARQFKDGAWLDPVPAVGGTTGNDHKVCSVEDADGTIWLIWSRGAIGSGGDVFMMRRDALGQWGSPRQLVRSAGDDTAPFGVAGTDTTVWVFWASDRDGFVKIYCKRLVTAV
jgi:hypothetical protein